MGNVHVKDIKNVIKDKKDYIPDNYKDTASGHSAHHGEHGFSSERIFNYKDKKVVIQTTYKVEIDGVPLQAHVAVSDDGTVHCHGLPNYSFASATSLVKNLIDASGLAKVQKNELFASPKKENDENGDDHSHHHGHHDHH